MSSFTLKDALQWGTQQIRSTDESPSASHRKARELLAFVTSLSIEQLLCSEDSRRLSSVEQNRYKTLTDNLSSGRPIEYLLGEVSFYDSKIRVSDDVLIPRPETEELCAILIETVFQKKAPQFFLDIGTGSGAIAIALTKAWKESQCVATDISEKALKIAKRSASLNAVSSRVRFLRADLWTNSSEKFDLIVSNPPYISQNDRKTLPSSVWDHEPHIALMGGVDGCDFYRAILSRAHRFLKDSGLIAFEIGSDQAGTIVKLLSSFKWKHCRVLKDCQKRDRFLFVSNDLSTLRHL